MSRVLLLVLLAVATAPAEDPYVAWSQGRPAEAVPALVAGAGARWDAWYDAGLAAAAANDRGRAVACLAQAMTLAPAEDEPRQALRALGVEVPVAWQERAGPLAWPGQGWAGVAVLGLAGLALGWAVAGPRARRRAAALGLVALAVAAPGVAAGLLDGRTAWTGTVRDTHLLDSAGQPVRALPAGTLLIRPAQEAWAGRVLVQVPGGTTGFVPGADLTP